MYFIVLEIIFAFIDASAKFYSRSSKLITYFTHTIHNSYQWNLREHCEHSFNEHFLKSTKFAGRRLEKLGILRAYKIQSF